MKYLLIVALFLAGCDDRHSSEPEQPFVAAGVWASPYGYLLKVHQDGTYEFCDGPTCDRGQYYELTHDYVVLRNFFSLSTARHFIELSEIEPGCVSSQGCELPSGIEVGSSDLNFFSTVAPVDRERECGSKICTVLGNVESGQGILYKEI